TYHDLAGRIDQRQGHLAMMKLKSLPNNPARLIEILAQPDPASREQAAYALGRLFPVTGEVLAALGESLFDDDHEVCRAAGVSLFGYGARSKPALSFLMR